MRLLRFYSFLFLLSPALILASEPSAFGAGDLTSSNPYGLTPNEKVLLSTEKRLKSVARKSNSQANELNQLNERVDGMQSVVESLGRSIHTNKVAFHDFKNATDASFENINEYQRSLAISIQENQKSLKELQKIMKDYNQSLLEIEANYVSREDFNKLVKDINDFQLLVAKEIKQAFSSQSKKKDITSAELYKRAKANYNKRYYTAAIADYERLIARRYKPAYSHYMIGEMYYKRKNYAKAISYFKKSSTLYAKASYMPKLLLHTAIAMQKTGDRQHSILFFNAIISKYPHSKEAQEAKKYLEL